MNQHSDAIDDAIDNTGGALKDAAGATGGVLKDAAGATGGVLKDAAGDVGSAVKRMLLMFTIGALITVIFFALSSRGMGKRYAFRYGHEKMAAGTFALWVVENFFNGLTGGLLGAV